MKGARQHSHASTQQARGELHFNEFLILVSAPGLIIDSMNIYVVSLKFSYTRNRREILGLFRWKWLISVCQT